MSKTLVAISIVCLTSILTYIGLAFAIIIAHIEYHAHVSLIISMSPAVTIIAVVVVATSTAFK